MLSMVIDKVDLRLAASDPLNSLERRSLNILNEQIDEMERKLYGLKFVRETICRHLSNT